MKMTVEGTAKGGRENEGICDKNEDWEKWGGLYIDEDVEIDSS